MTTSGTMYCQVSWHRLACKLCLHLEALAGSEGTLVDCISFGRSVISFSWFLGWKLDFSTESEEVD